MGARVNFKHRGKVNRFKAIDPFASLAYEQTVVGGLMLDGQRLETATGILTPDDFYDPFCRLVYETILETYHDLRNYFAPTVAGRMAENGATPVECSGALQLAADTATGENMDFFAGQVKRKSLERQRQIAAEEGNWSAVRSITASIDGMSSQGPIGIPTISDILSRSNEHDWLVKGWIEHRQTVVLFGESQSYKSLLAIDLTCCIATGKNWRGIPVKQGGILYIVGEGAGSGLTRRFRAWEIANQCPLKDTPILIQESATVLPHDADRLIAEAKAALLSRGWALALVIFDTLNRTMAGDERDSGDFSQYQRALDRIKSEFDCSAMYIHHTGHADKGRERGVSEIGCNADVRMQLEIIGDKTRRLHAPKVKDSDTPNEIIFTLAVVEIGLAQDGDPISSVVLRQLIDHDAPKRPLLRPQQRMVLQLLGNLYQHHRQKLQDLGEPPAHATVGVDEWGDAMKETIRDKGQRSRLRSELVQAGMVVIEDGFAYLTETGVNELAQS